MIPKSPFQARHGPPRAVIGIASRGNGDVALPRPTHGSKFAARRPFIRWMSVQELSGQALREEDHDRQDFANHGRLPVRSGAV
jgi:hypothetical protein